MSEQLNREMIENFSKVLKGGKQSAIDMQKRLGDIIRKETDKYGNVKYYFTEHDYMYYDFLRAEMALEDNSDDD